MFFFFNSAVSTWFKAFLAFLTLVFTFFVTFAYISWSIITLLFWETLFISFLQVIYTIALLWWFQIVFGNKTLKKFINKILNKPIKIKLKFRIHKPLIYFYTVNQHMRLILKFMRTIKSGDTNWYHFINRIKWKQGNYLCKF